MQTQFTDAQLAQPHIQQADKILRSCVHCGFCTATCPTYVLTGDERDSPRGRIWMIRDMLQSDSPAPAETAHHLDRCLTCLSCMTTCPSGVDYMHLVDIGRAHVEQTRTRPVMDRFVRWILGMTVPRAGVFALSLRAARMARPFAGLLPKPLAAMVKLAPKTLKPLDAVGGSDAVYPAEGKRVKRVALLAGCAQRAMDPEINASTIRVLNRLGVEVVVKQAASCCGALAHHINQQDAAHQAMRQTVSAWSELLKDGGLDAVVVNTSGCGTTVKDYGHLLKDDPELSMAAKTLSSMAMDITEFLSSLPALPVSAPQSLKVGYHAACSLQHGQKITDAPKRLLQRAGFQVSMAKEAHLCCGSAGVYNVLQSDLADKLKARKLANMNALDVDVVVAGNVGCMNQLADGQAPVCHTVQLLDWATGGPKPAILS